jgi:hypothetical protein
MVPATAENVERLEEWFRTVELGYQTEPWPAVQLALELEPDAIYLLSDGEFSPMTRQQLSLLNYRLVDDRQVRPAVVVNTFAMHGREGANNLRAIARENGGEYRFVFVATPGGLGPVRRSVALPANQAPAADALLRVGARLEGNEQGHVRRVVYSRGDEGMSSIRRLVDIRELWLANSYVTDEGLRSAQDLPRLEVLILSNSNITDESAYTIAQMKQLRALFLDGTEITEQGMERIVRLPQLSVLSTPGTLTDLGLRSLEQLENLQVLYLHERQVTDTGMEVIARLVRLQELSLQGTRITDHGLPALRTLSQLEVLRLDGTQVSDRAIECFKQWPLLRLLGIRDTLIGPAGQERLRTELPGVRLEK